MKRIFLFISMGLTFLSCTEEEKIPNYVIDKETFSELMCDYTLAESAANINVKNVRFEKYDSAYAFNPLKDHNVTRQQFDTSLYFYSHHPAMFREVYTLALEKLSEFQSTKK